MAERYGVLPRAGGVLDQDPLDLTKLRIAAGVIDEKRKIEEDKNKPKGH
jgi:hypothetical protein